MLTSRLKMWRQWHYCWLTRNSETLYDFVLSSIVRITISLKYIRAHETISWKVLYVLEWMLQQLCFLIDNKILVSTLEFDFNLIILEKQLQVLNLEPHSRHLALNLGLSLGIILLWSYQRIFPHALIGIKLPWRLRFSVTMEVPIYVQMEELVSTIQDSGAWYLTELLKIWLSLGSSNSMFIYSCCPYSMLSCRILNTERAISWCFMCVQTKHLIYQ